MDDKLWISKELLNNIKYYRSKYMLFLYVLLLIPFIIRGGWALPSSDDEEIELVSKKASTKPSNLSSSSKDKNISRAHSKGGSRSQISLPEYFRTGKGTSTSSSSSHSNKNETIQPRSIIVSNPKPIPTSTFLESENDDDLIDDSADESQSREKKSPLSIKGKEEDITQAKRKVSTSQSKEISPLKRQKTGGPQKPCDTSTSSSSKKSSHLKGKAKASDKRPTKDVYEEDGEDSTDAASDDNLFTIETDTNNENEARNASRAVSPSPRSSHGQQESASKSSSRKTEANASLSTPTNKTNLNVYLMETPKNYQLFPAEFGKIAECLTSFPWQFINETKYCLIRTEDKNTETNNDFINAQVYTSMGRNKDETIYVFQQTGLRQTEWIKPIQSQTQKYKKAEETRNPLFVTNQYKEPKCAVVFIKKPIKRKDRFFALTFGQTGRFLLNLDHCYNSFGKHYAYNILVSSPAYKSHSFTEINLDEKKLKHERAKTHGNVVVLRGATASIPKAMTVTNGKQSICSFIGAHILLRDEFDFGTTGEKCQQWLEISQKDEYKSKYSCIDDFDPLEDEELGNELLASSLDTCHIDSPFELYTGHEFQTIHKYQLSSKYSWPKHYEPLKKQYQEFAELSNELSLFLRRLASKQLKEVSPLKLLRGLIIVPKGDTDNPLSRWRAHELISGTASNEGKTYWIEGGELFKVSKNYIKLVNERINDYFLLINQQDTLEEDEIPSLRLLRPFKDKDTEIRMGKPVLSENAYNGRMARKSPNNFALCDCKNIRIQEDSHPQSKVEPCDLLSKEGDLIHVKRWTSSSAKISELVSQALHSARMMVEEKSFLEEFIKKIPNKPSFVGLKEKLKKQKVRIIIAFIHKKPNIKPDGLPINAKIDLYRALVEIENMGFKSNIIAIKDDSKEKTKNSSQLIQSSISLPLTKSSSSSGSASKVSYTDRLSSKAPDTSSDGESSSENSSTSGDEDDSDIIDF